MSEPCRTGHRCLDRLGSCDRIGVVSRRVAAPVSGPGDWASRCGNDYAHRRSKPAHAIGCRHMERAGERGPVAQPADASLRGATEGRDAAGRYLWGGTTSFHARTVRRAASHRLIRGLALQGNRKAASKLCQCTVTVAGGFAMRITAFVLLLPLALAGCLSFTSSPSPPRQTIVVPPAGSTVVCSNGLQPPC